MLCADPTPYEVKFITIDSSWLVNNFWLSLDRFNATETYRVLHGRLNKKRDEEFCLQVITRFRWVKWIIFPSFISSMFLPFLGQHWCFCGSSKSQRVRGFLNCFKWLSHLSNDTHSSYMRYLYMIQCVVILHVYASLCCVLLVVI